MPTRHLLKLAATLALCAGLAPAVQAAAVFINNASFEADVLGEETNTDNFVTGWISHMNDSGGCNPQCFGVYNPGGSSPSVPSGIVPNGNNVLYLVSPSGLNPVYQTLAGTVLTANTRYTLTVTVGNTEERDDYGAFGFRLGVVGSNNTYAALTDDLSSITNGTFVELSASSMIQPGNPDIGKTLVVELFGPSQPGRGMPYAVMDNVRLDATVTAVPEPATAALVAPGLALLGWLARRRR